MNELKVQPLVGGRSVSNRNHHDEIVLKVQLGISDEVLCFGGQLATQRVCWPFLSWNCQSSATKVLGKRQP